MRAKKYDLIVIGGGAAGLGSSGVAARLGLKVLMIEKTDAKIGGDCLNFGCVPSKSLIYVSKQFQGGTEARKFGLTISGKADIQKVLEYVHQRQDTIRHHENATHLREKEGIDVELGTAQFADEKTVEVNGNRFTADKIILATGSSPIMIPIPGIEKVAVYTNEALFYELKKLPQHFLFIGGGAIGCEMAQAFNRFGSKVTIVDLADRILTQELPAFSQIMKERLENEEITIHLESKITSFPDKNTAVVENKKGETFNLKTDAVLMAVGRAINTEGLGLEKAGIEFDRRKIKVDDYFRTTNKRVYVVGDAFGRHQFSHAAELHVRQLFFNLLVPFIHKKHTAKHLSWVTFTDPEVASFGYSEKDLQGKGIRYQKLEDSFSDDDRAITADYRYGKLVLYLSKPHWLTQKVKILGGTMLAPGAGDLIQELILANQTGLSINALFNKIYPYPTAARINQKLIVDYKSAKLTPLLRKVLRFLFRW